MKKLFVSIPMKGRTEDEIKASIQKMKKIAEVYEGEELELIDSYVEDNPPKDNNQAIWYLGKSLEKLSQADVFIGLANAWRWNGFAVECDIANRYDLKMIIVDPHYVITNYDELIQKMGITRNKNSSNVTFED